MNRTASLLAALLLVTGNLAAVAQSQPGGPPTRDPTGPRPGTNIPLPPIDPTLPSTGQQPELTLPAASSGGLVVIGNWQGQPLAQSPALTELASVNGLLPEPVFLFELTESSGGAAGSGTLAGNNNNNPPNPALPADPQIANTPPAIAAPTDPQTPNAGPTEPSLPTDVVTSDIPDTSAAQLGTELAQSTTALPRCQPQSQPIADSDQAAAAYAELSACYRQAVDYARAQGQQALEIQALNNLAIAEFVQGNYAEALSLHQQQLRAANDEVQAAIARSGIGNCYAALGAYETAIVHYTQALPHLRIDAAPQWRSLTLRNLGVAYYAQRDLVTAEQYQQQSLQLSSQLGDRYGVMQALGNLANLLAITNRFDAATGYYQRALDLARELNTPLEEAQLLLGLGTAYAYQQNYPEAVQHYERSLEKSRQLGARLGEGIALTNLGDALLRLNRLPEAETYLYDGVALWETLRAGLGSSDDFKVSLFETQRAAYNNLQEVLVKQNKSAAALVVSERGRARAFVELLARGGVGSAKTAPDLQPTLEQLQQVAIAQQATLVEYAIIRDQTTPLPHAASPQFRPDPAADSAAWLYIWVIQPTGDVHFRQVDLQQASVAVAALIQESRQRLRGGDRAFGSNSPIQPGDLVRRQGDPPTWAPYEVVAVDVTAGTVTVTHAEIALPNPTLPLSEFTRVASASPWTPRSQPLHQLHSLLIDPIAELLPADPTAPVVFVPQEQLFLVPFPALQSGRDQYLIDRHTILTAPTIQVVNATAAPSKWQNPLVVGNPSPMPQSLSALPYAQAEAQQIAQLLNTTPLVQTAATEAAVKQRLSQAGLIHLATHGFFDESDPLQGSLALSAGGQQDGFLTAREILELPLSAQLVVLSACDTGRGQITGDGVLGLSRSFLAAGADQVLVSLWRVPDEATGELMVTFYQQLQQGHTQAQALRQAMLATRETYPHPRAWAAFTLVGQVQ